MYNLNKDYAFQVDIQKRGLTSVNNTDFFSTLNYSSCNEDWRTERQALQADTNDHILCVCGSGDRALHLLLDNPKKITAIDLNPFQTNLLRLKMNAMENMPFDDYVSFLGLHPSDDRTDQLKQLANKIEPELSDFWAQQQDMIEAGILYQGRWEKYYQTLSKLVNLTRSKVIKELFSFQDIRQQRKFVESVWDKAWWRYTYLVLCSRLFSRIFFKDPAFYENVAPEMQIGDYVYNALLESLNRYPARENFMVSLLFNGELPGDDLPPYIEETSVNLIRPQLNKIDVKTDNLIEHLEKASPGTYSCFSLSDVPSYLDENTFKRLLRAMTNAAADNARFCIRQFLSGYTMPDEFKEILTRDTDLEQKLEREDRAFAYRFFVGTIKK